MALVEFALVMPVLFLLVFGIIEFGWTFLQNLDVRHGAREGARLVAVNYDPNSNAGAAQTTDIVTEICNRLDKKTGVTIDLSVVDTVNIGGTASVSIHKPDDQITGYIPWALPSTLNSTVQIRLEQKASWQNVTGAACS